jgi:hypothetical protein
MTNKLKKALRIMLVFLPFVLSGCITANSSISVQTDGTGEMITSLGFPIELVAEMTLQGINPVKDLKQFIFDELRHGIRFEEDDDNSFEWLTITRDFDSVEELSDLLQQLDFVESFSLQRDRGFLQDRFVLNAQLILDNFSNPLEFELEDVAGDLLPGDEFPFDFQLSIQLPGTVLETNGVHDSISNIITWSTDSTDALELHAISESWNTLSLAVTAGLTILGIALIVAIIVLVVRSRRKSKPGVEDANVRQRLVESVQPVEDEELSEPEPEKEEVFPPSKILAMIGARGLLDQVNHHVLNNRGEITVAKGAIRLVWTDQEDTTVTRGIMITVQDTETIVINGVPFPANREAAREGLISCLKGLTQQH